MLTALLAQTAADKGCPLQFYKTTSFPWDRGENLIDDCVKLLQLTFPQSVLVHGHGRKAFHTALTSSSNARRYSLPECCLLMPPTEEAMLE